jgi:FtsH-binding integral membrane protein
MADNNKYYYERQQYHPGDVEISASKYNTIIGAVLLYGFIVNAIMVKLIGTSFLETGVVGVIGGVVVYIICCIVGAKLIHGSDNPVVSFIGYNLYVIPIGVIISGVVSIYLKTSPGVVTRAFVLTAIITAVMMAVSTFIPDTFLSMGKTLLVALLVCIVVDVIAIFLGHNLVIIDYAVTFIFSLFVGYDWARANACVKTVDNAIDSAAELYIDIINLFLRILSILGRSND